MLCYIRPGNNPPQRYKMTVAKSLLRQLGLLLLLLVLGFSARIASAQSGQVDVGSSKFTTLYTFSGPNGALPMSGVVQATNGDYFGTTTYSGANCDTAEPCGTVFKISSNGALTTLYNFCAEPGCADGAAPGALIQATNGELYGTASGGLGYPSTVFKITPGGAFTTLYTFCSQTGCPDGVSPQAGLVQAANGDLYGTTTFGGANGQGGTIFKITPSGTLTTLYSFCSQAGCLDGSGSYAPLVQARNGDLYGTTMNGGTSSLGFCSFTNGCGTIIRITPTGTLTTLYNFCSQSNCNDGGNSSGLVQADNGDLYGVTFGGGAYGGGTVYKITPSGLFTTVYNFCTLPNCTDGTGPHMGLIRAADESLWGTTTSGGADGNSGTFFEITPSGKLTTQDICPYPGCLQLPSGMVQGTDGNFYGTTAYGGPRGTCSSGGGCGTIFSLSTGQAPFVETRPTAGKVGEAVTIPGNSLTGTTSVTFNATPAAFTVVSSTEVRTTVPAGATSGKVQVITPGGTLSSNVSFEVVP
jgi:uncharacterized repeat protein (TIGR03803 family)